LLGHDRQLSTGRSLIAERVRARYDTEHPRHEPYYPLRSQR
jgi:hypothetical protein